MRGSSLLVASLLLNACVPPPHGQLELSASMLDFGLVRPGNVVTQSLELRNGDGVPLSVISVTSTGSPVVSPAYAPATTEGVFALDLEQPLVLAPGETRAVEVRYQPINASRDEALLEFFLDEETPAATLRLVGTAPVIDCDNPEVFDFGGVTVGETQWLEYALLNARPVPAEVFIGEVEAGDTTIALDPGSPRGTITLAPGERRTVRWSFAPVAVGRSTARVRMQSGGCSYTARLLGDGLSVAFSPPAPVAFGQVQVGQGAGLNVSFLNYTRGPVTLSGLSLWEGSSSSAAFLIIATGTADLTRLIVPGVSRDANGELVPGSATLRLGFRPGVTGPHAGQLRAQTDLAVRPSIALNVTGEGVP